MNSPTTPIAKPLATLWFDLKTAIRSVDIPASFLRHCNVQHVDGIDESRIAAFDPDLIVLEFDYPARRDMERAAQLKSNFSGVPMIIVTLQHSEALAVWFFRKKFLDFLVQPVATTEVNESLAEISRIDKLRRKQKPRTLAEQRPGVPLEASAGQRVARPLRPALELVAHAYFDQLTVSKAAASCNMQPFRFGREFKEEFGIDFREYVVRYRIREACRLLRNPYAHVSEVAFAVGFSEPSYFSKIFKKLVGKTPSQVVGDADLEFALDHSDAYRNYL